MEGNKTFLIIFPPLLSRLGCVGTSYSPACLAFPSDQRGMPEFSTLNCRTAVALPSGSTLAPQTLICKAAFPTLSFWTVQYHTGGLNTGVCSGVNALNTHRVSKTQ